MATSTDNSSVKVSHTPGPWRYNDLTGEIFYADDDGVEPLVATVNWDGTSEEQADLDGLLIAAAPELLEALEQALASVEMPTGIGLGIGGLEFRYPPWVELARTAIARTQAGAV